MEDELELAFTPAAEQRSLWRQILAGLCEGEAGALFQERMEAFDPAVEAKLEAMLEVWPVEYFEGQYWEEDGERFCIGLLPGSDGDEFARDLEALFALCPVSDVRVEARYDGEGDE
jgi:hypothetical protein